MTDREIDREIAEMERHADTWPEAFRKQIMLCRREIGFADNEPEFDSYFVQSILASERALEIWHEVAVSKHAMIARLQEQIDQLRAEIPSEVADKLDAESNANAFENLSWSLRKDTPSSILD